LALASECFFTLASAKRQLVLIGPEAKELAKKSAMEFREIEKISMDEEDARYKLRCVRDGKEITRRIFFTRVFGSWKIAGYE
jgi:hypothetical protein